MCTGGLCPLNVGFKDGTGRDCKFNLCQDENELSRVTQFTHQIKAILGIMLKKQIRDDLYLERAYLKPSLLHD